MGNMVAAVAACVALLLTSAAAAGPPDGSTPLLVPGSDQVGRGYDPATGSDVGMLFSFKAQVGTQSSSLFPSHAVPSGLVVAAAPEQLGSPTTKVIGTYRSYVDMRSAQAGLPVSAAGFFALNDEAKKMQTTLRNKYVAFTEQTVERFKLKVQYASTEDGALTPELRPEVLAAFNALPIEGDSGSDDPPEDVPGASAGKTSGAAPAAKGNKYSEFIKRYGPYYVKSATFGGAIRQVAVVNRAGHPPGREAIEAFCDNKLRESTSQESAKGNQSDGGLQPIEIDQFVIQ